MNLSSPQAPALLPTHWVLDANVLFSEFQRTLVFEWALATGAHLHWSEAILDECGRNLIRLQRMTPQAWEWHSARWQADFPDATLPPAPVYEQDVRMVDEKDRHVAALALGLRHRMPGEAIGLMTWNVKDFPKRPLHKKGIERYSPDEWFSAWMHGQSAHTTLGVLDKTARACESARAALQTVLTEFEHRARHFPQQAADWPDYLHALWLKATARHLAARLPLTLGQ